MDCGIFYSVIYSYILKYLLFIADVIVLYVKVFFSAINDFAFLFEDFLAEWKEL
jgi:hypothetical protein